MVNLCRKFYNGERNEDKNSIIAIAVFVRRNGD